MSDYSYCIVHTEPPRPHVSLWLRLLSWRKPVCGWTSGTANGWEGLHAVRREWEIRKGVTRPVGILHSCADSLTCRCATGRQFGNPAPVVARPAPQIEGERDR